MNKCHNPIVWRNNTTPAINETNLNYEDGCIDTLDDRVIYLDGVKAEQSELLSCLASVTYNDNTGVFTFTWKNGTTASFDLNIEKIPVSFSMDANGVITMTTADGTQYTADVSTMVKVYAFVDSSEIDFTVTRSGNNYTVTASIINGSITENKLQPNFLAECRIARNGAEDAESASNANRLTAEGHAKGTQNDVPVESTSPYYQNNAKYYAETSAQNSEAWARGTRNGVPVSSSDPEYHNNSKFYAETSYENAEAWADGTRGGVPVDSSDPAYHNNAKYWKEQAQAIAQQSLSSLSDVSISNPQDGEVTMYNSQTQEWENKMPVRELEDLSNVGTNSTADYNVLGYFESGGSGTWTNCTWVKDEIFELIYSLVNKVTTINKDASGNVTSIVEQGQSPKFGDTVTATTTFSTNNNVKTITTILTGFSDIPGLRKITTITPTVSGIEIDEAYGYYTPSNNQGGNE